MSSVRTITPTLARRLFIHRQHLAGACPPANAEGIMTLMRDLGSVQLDPISVVARSHRLVLFSRLGAYDIKEFDRLLWEDRLLFEYWAHAASIVLTEHYPIHNWLMRRYSKDDNGWHRRIREWMEKNRLLQRHILRELRRKGPLPSRYFEEQGIPTEDWVSTGWTSGRNINRMLDFLWIQGKIMVAGRDGLQKLWDIAERQLPEWTPRERLAEKEVVRRAAQLSLRALGVATPQHIAEHYTKGRYPNLWKVLGELEKSGTIERVEVRDRDETLHGSWFIHTEDLQTLDYLGNGAWAPRTTVLSPFDNLIIDRKRTSSLFGMEYRMEIYVPKAKRRFGYYVLPVLHGDRFIARIDPAMDRSSGTLTVNAVHAEPGAPMDRRTGRVVAKAIEELGEFLGAKNIVFTRRVPSAWKPALNS